MRSKRGLLLGTSFTGNTRGTFILFYTLRSVHLIVRPSTLVIWKRQQEQSGSLSLPRLQLTIMLTHFRGLRHVNLIIVLALILIYQQDSVHAIKLPTHSFAPPFRDIDNSGQRMVNTGWRAGGSTVINTNFVRLTPDQQVSFHYLDLATHTIINH